MGYLQPQNFSGEMRGAFALRFRVSENALKYTLNGARFAPGCFLHQFVTMIKHSRRRIMSGAFACVCFASPCFEKRPQVRDKKGRGLRPVVFAPGSGASEAPRAEAPLAEAPRDEAPRATTLVSFHLTNKDIHLSLVNITKPI